LCCRSPLEFHVIIRKLSAVVSLQFPLGKLAFSNLSSLLNSVACTVTCLSSFARMSWSCWLIVVSALGNVDTASFLVVTVAVCPLQLRCLGLDYSIVRRCLACGGLGCQLLISRCCYGFTVSG